MQMTTTTQSQWYGGRRSRGARRLALCALLLELVCFCLVLGGGHLKAAPPPAPHSTAYPPARLRGYGVVAGTFTATQIDGKSASTLIIVCEDQEKAKLVQAKYLSDLQLLPGVEKTDRSAGPFRSWPWRGNASRSGRAQLSVYTVKDQGSSSPQGPGRKCRSWPRQPSRDWNNWSTRTSHVRTRWCLRPKSACRCFSTAGTSMVSGSITVLLSNRRTPIIATSRPTTHARILPSPSSRASRIGGVEYALQRAVGGWDYRFQFARLGLQGGPPVAITHGREPWPGRQECQPGQPLSQ